MKVDNRIFITPAGPFVLYFFVKFFIWVTASDVSGAEGFIAYICFVLGLMLGGAATATLITEKISLGHFYIGRRDKE